MVNAKKFNDKLFVKCKLRCKQSERMMGIFVRLTTGPVPPNRPIPTNGPILATGSIVSAFPTNGPIFPTTRPTFKRHFHKWAERNV